MAVLAMREHGGRTIATPIANTDAGTVQAEIHRHVETGSTLHTDEAGAYAGIGGMFFDHDTVNHSEGEFVRDGVTTNSVESVFAVAMVLAYRPKPKTKPARKRERARRRLEKDHSRNSSLYDRKTRMEREDAATVKDQNQQPEKTLPYNPIDSAMRTPQHARRTIQGVLESYNSDDLAEAIQNSMDACEDAAIQKLPAPYQLQVTVNLKDNTITVLDPGIGMTKEQICEAFAPSASFKDGSEIIKSAAINSLIAATKVSDLHFSLTERTTFKSTHDKTAA
jgi:hypothetical protein